MRTVLLASAGMFALSAFAPAMAADMAARAPYVKAPPPVAIYNWTGFYVGGFGGYASENSGTPSMEGGFGGGTIGYNWQAGNIVYGLEVDAAGADIDASVSTLGVTARSKIDSLGTVRGRFGFAVDKVLFYGTGGYAWANNEVSVTALGVTASQSNFHSGWTVGRRRRSVHRAAVVDQGRIPVSQPRQRELFRRALRHARAAQRPVRRQLSLRWPDRRQVLRSICDQIARKGRPRAGLFA
ncbi:hypothetical protein AB7M43_006819 [Bradyrhizobium elkanii]